MGSITSRQWLILLTVQFVTVLFGITITSVGVILPQMKGALSATQDQVSWILTFNMVATAVATPLTGWLAARLGWRTLLISSAAGFTISSVLCGMVDSLESLLVLRVIQGAFGAPIFPMGQAILLASFAESQHAFILMMWGVGGVMGPILGPTFGGLIAEALNWRWAFILILPLGIVAGALVYFVLDDRHKGKAQPFDYLGFLFVGVAIGAAQLMFDRGQRNDWFDSAEIVIEFTLAAVFIYLFIAHMLTTRAPLFSPATFADRNFSLGITFAFIMGALQYTPMVLFPPLLQELRGFPDSVIGQLIAARGLGNWASFFVVVPMTRRWPRFTVGLGFGAQALAGLGMAQIDINVTIWEVFWTNALQGFGVGLCYTSMTVIAFATLPPRKLMEGNSLFHLMRNFGSSVFISMAVALYVRSAAENYADLTQHVSPFNETFLYPLLTGRWSFDEQAGLASLSREVARQAQMIGYINAFYLFAISAAAVIPLLFFVRRPRPA